MSSKKERELLQITRERNFFKLKTEMLRNVLEYLLKIKIKECRTGHFHELLGNKITLVLVNEKDVDAPMEKRELELDKISVYDKRVKVKLIEKRTPVVLVTDQHDNITLFCTEVLDFKNTIIRPFLDYSKFEQE